MKKLKLYLVSICYFIFLVCSAVEIKRINNIYNIELINLLFLLVLALTLVFYIIWIKEHLNKNL